MTGAIRSEQYNAMNKPTAKLKYLFEVKYADGEIYRQTPRDKSKIDPEKRSEFYDVLQEIEKGRTIQFFSLVGDGKTITVDLGTGLFYVNGVKLLLESEKLPVMPEKFDLIFYRQWTQQVNVEYKGKKIGPFEIVSEEPQQAFCEYFIGWKCEIKGKRYIQKMAVA